MICAYATDLKQRGAFAFWLYLLGLLAFSGGLTALDSDSEVAKLAYCLIHLALIALAAWVDRQIPESLKRFRPPT